MPVESYLTPEETPALAAQATALIDATLSRLAPEDRAAFWASVRKCYNTPYNDPKPRALPGRATADREAAPAAALTACVRPEMYQREAERPPMAMAAIPGTAPFVEAHPS